MIRRFFALVLVVVAVVGCPGQTLFPKCDDPAHPCPPVEPNYPTSDRDGVGTPIGDACVQLRRLGCPEGFGNAKSNRTCFESYTDAAKLAAVPADCLRSSGTQGAARGCGNANSVRVRCIMPAAGEEGSKAP